MTPELKEFLKKQIEFKSFNLGIGIEHQSKRLQDARNHALDAIKSYKEYKNDFLEAKLYEKMIEDLKQEIEKL